MRETNLGLFDERVDAAAEPRRTGKSRSFVGRARELQLADGILDTTLHGRGQLLLVAGDAGIGKTHFLDEIAARARGRRMLVLRGHCDEDAAVTYGPFRMALAGYVAEASEATLRRQLGRHASVLATLVPSLSERLGDLTEPAALPSNEERTRLLDAVSQSLIAIAAETPLALVIDDVHWIDDDGVALLRHLGRTLAPHRVLLVAAYRGDEVPDEGPTAQAMALLRRQASVESISLEGLAKDELGALLQSLAEERSITRPAGPVDDDALVNTIAHDTRGNPFFVRSLVLHLEEEGQLRLEEGKWQATMPLEDLALPEGLRQTLWRRLKRLTQDARTFLAAAAVVGFAFCFEVVTRASDLDDERALAVIDAALLAQLIEPGDSPDTYHFAHALVRQALYEALNPSRQVRLHRRVAEALEATLAERAVEHASELALHYHRSRTLPGSERGVAYALQAADRAEAVVAHGEARRLLRIALELLPAQDPRRPQLLMRFALASICARDVATALPAATEAAALLSATAGDDVAAEHLAGAIEAGVLAGLDGLLFPLAPLGLAYAGSRRDRTWAVIMLLEIKRQEAGDPDFPGIAMSSPERLELARVTQPLAVGADPLRGVWEDFQTRRSRRELLACGAPPSAWHLGDYRGGVRLFRARAEEAERSGRLGVAFNSWCAAAEYHTALGDFVDARSARDRAVRLASRFDEHSRLAGRLLKVEDEWRMARDEDWDAPMMVDFGNGSSQPPIPSDRAAVDATIARSHARMGRSAKALRRLPALVPLLERAPGWAETYIRVTFDVAETLWLTSTAQFVDVVKRNALEKIVEPDFRAPMTDGRLAIARLCALQHEYDEAREWFAKARTVLDEQGARPLRAVADYDEALMYHRRGESGDAERARPLLDAALAQFREIDMPGWIRRAEALLAQPSVERTSASPAGPRAQPLRAHFRQEGDFWTVAYDGKTVRLKSSRGMLFLSRLLGEAGEQIAAIDLVTHANGTHEPVAPADLAGLRIGGAGDAGDQLDAAARASYKRRLGELRAEVEEAERGNHVGEAERLRAEADFLTRELRRAVGRGGRVRRAGSPAERARINATRAIAAALEKIAALHPPLAEHLRRTIRTGTFCSYTPDPRAPIEWQT